MKSLKYIILVICISATSFATSNGQMGNPNPSILNVGDTININTLFKLSNAKESQLPFKKLKGKWLILDFWATYCQACINAVPELNKIQEKFKSDLNILMVTSERKERIDAFFEVNKFVKHSNIPSIVEDTLLRKLFPHRIIPHEIWIDPMGVVKAITGGEELSETNIRNMISNESFKLKVKSDQLNWTAEKERDLSIIYSSKLEKYKEGTPSGSTFRKDSTGLFYRVYLFNTIPVEMLYSTFSYLTEDVLGNINEKRVVVEIKDSLTERQYAYKNHKPVPFYPQNFPFLSWSSYKEWEAENLYSYELEIEKPVERRKMMEYIFKDLNRFLPIKGRVEKREVDCWVLQIDAFLDKSIKSKGGKPSIILSDTKIGVSNKPIEEFLKLVAKSVSVDPIINETSLRYNVDLTVDFSGSSKINSKLGLVINNPINMEILSKTLGEVGFKLTRASRYIDMLVIYD